MEAETLMKEFHMFRSIAARAASVVALAAALTVVSGAVTQAASAGEFGQHVRTCTQTMGFNGEHNPGMHQGFHGWDPEHVC